MADKEGNAGCECCGSEYVLPKIKHLADVKCPVCKRNLKVLHKYRRKHEECRTCWKVVVNVIDSNTLVLRYIFVSRNDDKINFIKECAREVINLETKETRYWELIKSEWKRQDREYFKEFFMYTFRTHMCCLQADIHNMNAFIKELRKIDAFKYVEFKSILKINTRYVSNLIRETADMYLPYEQLQKAGYTKFVIDNLTNTDYGLATLVYNADEKSLGKKIGLSDRTFKMLKECQTMDDYTIFRRHPDISEQDYKILKEWGWDRGHIDDFLSYNLTIKQGKYIRKNDLSIYEYNHYIRLCNELNYPNTEYYIYPKDFRNMDMIVSNEYQAQRDKIAYEKRQKNSKQIHLISEKIREIKEIQQLMNGLNGLLVYVPDSADDLTKEGKALNNCIGTYVERIALQKTLIFYIRQIENPTKPFVAMEVSYEGKIHQVRYDHNVSVKESNILDFADKVANVVKVNSKKLMLAA